MLGLFVEIITCLNLNVALLQISLWKQHGRAAGERIFYQHLILLEKIFSKKRKRKKIFFSELGAREVLFSLTELWRAWRHQVVQCKWKDFFLISKEFFQIVRFQTWSGDWVPNERIEVLKREKIDGQANAVDHHSPSSHKIWPHS